MLRIQIAAILNVMIGNESGCIECTIDDAMDWMADHKLGSKVSGSSDAWREGERLYLKLDKYNNGLLCAPSRDSLE